MLWTASITRPEDRYGFRACDGGSQMLQPVTVGLYAIRKISSRSKARARGALGPIGFADLGGRPLTDDLPFALSNLVKRARPGPLVPMRLGALVPDTPETGHGWRRYFASPAPYP